MLLHCLLSQSLSLYYLLDTIRGSTLGSGIRALNSVEAETAKGTTNGGNSLLSLIKATEWGSPTGVGLYQFILCPALIFMFSGTNIVNTSVEFPPPASTLIIVLLACSC